MTPKRYVKPLWKGTATFKELDCVLTDKEEWYSGFEDTQHDVFGGENATEFVNSMRDNIRNSINNKETPNFKNKDISVPQFHTPDMHFETPHGDPYGETTHGETAQMYEETIHGEIRVETPHGDTYGETTMPVSQFHPETIHGETRETTDGETIHGETWGDTDGETTMPVSQFQPETIHGETSGITDGKTIHREIRGATDGETTMPVSQFHPSDLVGQTFLMKEQEDRQRFHAQIVETIGQHKETGEVMAEPLTMIAADDTITCAIYAREKGLLDKPDWKLFKGIAKKKQEDATTCQPRKPSIIWIHT